MKLITGKQTGEVYLIKPKYLEIVQSVEAEAAKIDAEIAELQLLRDEALEASHDYDRYLDSVAANVEPMTVRQYYQARSEFEQRQDLVEEACESDDRALLCEMVLAHGPRIEGLRAMLEGQAGYG